MPIRGETPMDRARTKDEQRFASTERILACALELFVRHGYRATTVDLIAARAGLTKGAVYFYFKTKEAIMLRLLDDAEGAVVDPVVALMSEGGAEADALDKMVRFLHHQSAAALSHPRHHLLLILTSIEFYGTNTRIEVRVRAIYRRLYASVEGFVHQGQAEGEVRTDLRSHELTAILMAVRDGTLIEWYRRPGELEGSDLTRAARVLLLDGLKARS